MAACPICGMALAGAPQRCPACNSDLASASALMDDILGAPAAPPPSPQAKPIEKPRVNYGRVVMAAFLWGWAGGLVLGLGLGIVLHLLFGMQGNFAAFMGGVNFGGMTGFLLGSIWGVVSTLELDLGKAALAGAVLGAADATVHCLGESLLIAPPDFPPYMYSIVGCAAGAVAGAASAILREYRENA